MSEIYRRNLVRVQAEFDAARDAIDYVLMNWQRQNVGRAISSSPEELRRASTNLEAIFFVRLFSIFEGILKEHLDQRHPLLSVPEDARAVWLIDRAAQRQNPPISVPLRLRVQDVRRSRNFLVHPRGAAPPLLSFLEALAILGRFVNRLPEPY